MLSNITQVERLQLTELKDYHRQLRTPRPKQIEKTIRFIQVCEYIPPVIIDKNNTVVVGAHYVAAARQMGLQSIDVIRVHHLTEEKVKILRLAYDRIAEEADWDKKELAHEFMELQLLNSEFVLTDTAFDIDEINLTLDILPTVDPVDEIPDIQDGPAITKLGDVYELGDHRLVCGDATKRETFEALLRDEKAQMCFTDSPYNMGIDKQVSNSGKIKHREFVQASGEMTSEEHTQLLTASHQYMAEFSNEGAIIFSCMDWRHMREIQLAAEASKLTLINLCVWVKNNGGMGSLYRSRHELVLVLKNGKGKHINNVELGKNGRYRTNVWEYPGISSFGHLRMHELAMHPTVKPVAMVADAIKDCSKRGGIILDPFGGSGTTLIAAEDTGRKARLIELDPQYCDVIIRRWQRHTGKDAINLKTKKSFNNTK